MFFTSTFVAVSLGVTIRIKAVRRFVVLSNGSAYKLCRVVLNFVCAYDPNV